MFSFRGFMCEFVTSREYETGNARIDLVSEDGNLLGVLTETVPYPLEEDTVILKQSGYILELIGRLHEQNILSTAVRKELTRDGKKVLISNLVSSQTFARVAYA